MNEDDNVDGYGGDGDDGISNDSGGGHGDDDGGAGVGMVMITMVSGGVMVAMMLTM